METDGLVGLGGDTEAIGGGGGLGGLRAGVELPALADGLLDDDGAGFGCGVVDEVFDLGELGGLLAEDTFGDGNTLDALGVVGEVGGDADGLVGGVGEETALVGMDGVEEAFAAKVSVFDDGEAAAVKGEVAGVGDPEGAQGRGLRGRP